MKKLAGKINLADKRELRSRLIMGIGGVLLVYMVVSTIQALWQNYQINKELVGLREMNAELKLQNKYLQNLISYRKTDSFKDKEARAKLNFQKPGEAVLIIPEDEIQRFVEGNVKDNPNPQVIQRDPTNPEKWLKFIFG